MMMCQCFFGIILSLIMILGKNTKYFEFSKLAEIGIDIPDLNTVRQNSNLGIKVGLVGLIPVTFGAFALNYTSIPIYLAFRRCGLLSSVIVMYLWAGEHPSRGVMFSTALVTLGAVIASSENFSRDFIGFLCVWSYNFS